MRIRKRHNSVLYIINIVNPNKEFELKKLALERIDKVEDRIIQTNIMFILILGFEGTIFSIITKLFYNPLSLNLLTLLLLLALVLSINLVIFELWIHKIKSLYYKSNTNYVSLENIFLPMTITVLFTLTIIIVDAHIIYRLISMNSISSMLYILTLIIFISFIILMLTFFRETFNTFKNHLKHIETQKKIDKKLINFCTRTIYIIIAPIVAFLLTIIIIGCTLRSSLPSILIISFLVNVAIYLFILIHLILIFLGKEEYL